MVDDCGTLGPCALMYYGPVYYILSPKMIQNGNINKNTNGTSNDLPFTTNLRNIYILESLCSAPSRLCVCVSVCMGVCKGVCIICLVKFAVLYNIDVANWQENVKLIRQLLNVPRKPPRRKRSEWIGRDAERSEELKSLRSEDSDHFKHYLCMCDYFCRVIL